MFKIEIFLIALVVSWFLCSERPETGVQVSDSKVADGGKTITKATDDTNGGETITEATSKVEDKTPEPAPTDAKRIEGWVRLGALITLAAIVLKVL